MLSCRRASRAHSFIAERAAIGEQKEKVFALRMPDRARMFHDMYQVRTRPARSRAVRALGVYRLSPS